jgi:hypothetical protein
LAFGAERYRAAFIRAYCADADGIRDALGSNPAAERKGR